MFSKKPQPTARPAPSSAAEQAASRLRAAMALPLSNPHLSVAGAGLLLLAALGLLITVAGDPRAGAPSVRIALGGHSAPAGWREALSPGTPGEAVVTNDTFTLYEDAPGPVHASGGEAILNFPSAPRTFIGGGQALVAAPIAGMTEPGPGGGLLPIISAGRTPADAYARPFHSNGKPKVALVIGGLGLDPTVTRRTIEELPPEITLSFLPYGENLQDWIDLARAHGHEVLLETPMEPLNYPEDDPGPYALMAGATPEDTVRRTEWLLSRITGYFGLTNYMGGRFVTSETGMATLSRVLQQRGLAFIDDGAAARWGGGIPRATAPVIDDALSAQAIDAKLLNLEAVALQRGQALGSGLAYQLTLTQVSTWARSLAGRGYQLAPASAIMTRR